MDDRGHEEKRLLAALAAIAEVDPPAWLDERIRARLLRPAGRRLGRPALATGLALGALAALFFGLTVAFAEAGAAEQAVSLAVLLLVAYMVASVAVTAPLLLLRARRTAVALEVTR